MKLLTIISDMIKLRPLMNRTFSIKIKSAKIKMAKAKVARQI